MLNAIGKEVLILAKDEDATITWHLKRWKYFVCSKKTEFSDQIIYMNI
jgi:hypothetical protein